MKTFNRRYLVSLVVVLVGVSLWTIGRTGKDDTDTCVSCHSEVYDRGMDQSYLHTPFEKQECDRCHLQNKEEATTFQDTYSRTIVAPVVISQPDYLTEHTVLLKGTVAEETYDIRVTCENGNWDTVTKEMQGITPGALNTVKVNDGRPPRIESVAVGPVVKGIFLETVITWRTDEPSSSQVEYGLTDQYGTLTLEDSALVTEHRMNIYELEQDREYHFQVASRDMYGNEGRSEDSSFLTDQIVPVRTLTDDIESEKSSDPFEIRLLDVFVLGDALGIYAQTTEPARVSVEYVKVDKTEPIASEATEETPETTDIHGTLQYGISLMIDACYACHPPEVLGLSHPVGVSTRGKTRIPEDLPTLQGGVITCITCHHPHSADRRYFARKRISKEICVSCHEGY